MKIPALFGKAPRHQRFNYIPRYYDPQKEEAKEREERIRRELALERGDEAEIIANSDRRARISGALQAARKRSKQTSEPNTAMIRLGILLFIALFLIAFLTWGSVTVYSLLLFFPVYIYLKFFRKN